MCFQCLKKIMQERAKKKRNRDFAKKLKETPQSEKSTEPKASATATGYEKSR